MELTSGGRRAQKSAEPALRLADHARKFRGRAVFARHVLLGVAGRFGRGKVLRLVLRQSHLPQACCGEIHARLAHAKRRLRLRRIVPGGKIQIQKRRVCVRAGKKPLEIAIRYGNACVVHQSVPLFRLCETHASSRNPRARLIPGKSPCIQAPAPDRLCPAT